MHVSDDPLQSRQQKTEGFFSYSIPVGGSKGALSWFGQLALNPQVEDSTVM